MAKLSFYFMFHSRTCSMRAIFGLRGCTSQSGAVPAKPCFAVRCTAFIYPHKKSFPSEVFNTLVITSVSVSDTAFFALQTAAAVLCLHSHILCFCRYLTKQLWRNCLSVHSWKLNESTLMCLPQVSAWRLNTIRSPKQTGYELTGERKEQAQNKFTWSLGGPIRTNQH